MMFLMLDLKEKNKCDVLSTGFEGKQSVGDCFRFKRSKCLDYGFVFENVFESLRVFEFFEIF